MDMPTWHEAIEHHERQMRAALQTPGPDLGPAPRPVPCHDQYGHPPGCGCYLPR